MPALRNALTGYRGGIESLEPVPDRRRETSRSAAAIAATLGLASSAPTSSCAPRCKNSCDIRDRCYVSATGCITAAWIAWQWRTRLLRDATNCFSGVSMS